MSFNKIKWCFVTDGGSIAKLTWWSDKELISLYFKKHKTHWVEL